MFRPGLIFPFMVFCLSLATCHGQSFLELLAWSCPRLWGVACSFSRELFNYKKYCFQNPVPSQSKLLNLTSTSRFYNTKISSVVSAFHLKMISLLPNPNYKIHKSNTNSISKMHAMEIMSRKIS